MSITSLAPANLADPARFDNGDISAHEGILSILCNRINDGIPDPFKDISPFLKEHHFCKRPWEGVFYKALTVFAAEFVGKKTDIVVLSTWLCGKDVFAGNSLL